MYLEIILEKHEIIFLHIKHDESTNYNINIISLKKVALAAADACSCLDLPASEK